MGIYLGTLNIGTKRECSDSRSGLFTPGECSPQCTLNGKWKGTRANMDTVRRGKKKPIPFGNKTSVSGLRTITEEHEFHIQRRNSIQLHKAACSYTARFSSQHFTPRSASPVSFSCSFDELSCVVWYSENYD
jgi:hypothetical protein